jgi:threonine dehydratase
MTSPAWQDIDEAAARIAPLARRTPVERSSLLADAGSAVWLKMEIWQATGSFKMRGAFNRMAQLSAAERAGGVVTASAGNHAQGVAACAVALGIHAIIVVAEDASPAKVAALRRYDPQWVELRQMGRDYDEAEAAGIRLARELALPFISPYNDPAVIAGQGTVARELLEDVPDLDVILVPVGGGGLAAGIGIWAHHVNPAIRVIGVQSVASPAMQAAFAAGQLVTVPLLDSLADGLAGNIEPGSMTYALCREHLESVVLVSEASIAEAMRFLAEEQHVLVEGSGAVGVAALQSGAVTVPAGSKVGVVLSGRNVTLAWVRRVLA